MVRWSVDAGAAIGSSNVAAPLWIVLARFSCKLEMTMRSFKGRMWHFLTGLQLSRGSSKFISHEVMMLRGKNPRYSAGVVVENQEDGKPGHLTNVRLQKRILRVVLAHVIVSLSRVHPVNYKPFRMSHYVSISNSLLIDYNHHLLWLNMYLWQMQIPLLIDCDSKSPPPRAVCSLRP